MAMYWLIHVKYTNEHTLLATAYRVSCVAIIVAIDRERRIESENYNSYSYSSVSATCCLTYSEITLMLLLDTIPLFPFVFYR